MKPLILSFGIVGLGAIVACATIDMPEPVEGQIVFDQNCALCHGDSGRGDGLLAAKLQPAPPDLTRITFREKDVFPRTRVLSVIDGYTRQTPDEAMPEFGLLLEGETVPVVLEDGTLSPVPRPLAALLVYLESIQR
ncbi:c-type cytochrome [Seohaeicola sp. SP36]|uniref:c-type cytochrome n=1 Tax=unclassified Seohaeicola TaxID=2641111 RepID=UPI00237AFA90|nr:MULTISPECIES: c-type cytochrome [unclassified Seohaeicola]MDD9708130.1 c-type cytochrome [Seohaeicola sp. 4SK31]MDD9736094.1 c-type cytochrome [Seohaeicola sp. SP36]